MTKKFILIFLLISVFLNLNSYSENNTYSNYDKGIIALMYHRFDENKYPSTNIQMKVFKEQIETIENLNINFLHPKNIEEEILNKNKEKKILITIDDGFSSFYNNAWPYFKEKNIPFLLFIATADVGKKGYINWEIGLLSELGFSLKLDDCAVTGKKEDLAFVSPKTGRAVSYEVGYPYKNKLINLPRFLGGSMDRNKDNELKDLIQGLQLTKFFLEFNFFKDKPFPNSRLRFTKLLEDKLYKGLLNDRRQHRH